MIRRLRPYQVESVNEIFKPSIEEEEVGEEGAVVFTMIV